MHYSFLFFQDFNKNVTMQGAVPENIHTHPHRRDRISQGGGGSICLIFQGERGVP